jgi:hypothetical protein
MDKHEAAKWVREGMKLAKQFPERWIHRGWYRGWLDRDGTVWDFRPENPVGACGCVLGLTELARANGTKALHELPGFGYGEIAEALGQRLYDDISYASECSVSVDEMCERVEAVLREAGL